MEHSTKELLARLLLIGQHLEGTENALCRIADALEAIHKDLDKGNQLRWPLSGMPSSDLNN